MVAPSDVKIIVSRFNEDLKWTLRYPFNLFKYIVYNKGDDELFEKGNVLSVINLPNIGRNDHTYLHHLCENYDKLPLVTVFFPGSINLPHKMKRAINTLLNLIRPNNKKGVLFGERDPVGIYLKFKYFELDVYVNECKQNRKKNDETVLQKCTARPYGKWYKTFFGEALETKWTYWGIFAIHKNDIIQHPIIRYKTLLSILSTHSNPEAGHYVERSWCAIFSPKKHTSFYYYRHVLFDRSL